MKASVGWVKQTASELSHFSNFNRFQAEIVAARHEPVGIQAPGGNVARQGRVASGVAITFVPQLVRQG